MNAPAKSPLIPILERRVRALTWLAGATVVVILCAFLAQWQRGASGEAEFTPVRMFPALEEKVDAVASIEIEAPSAAFNVVKRSDGKWIVPDKGNYRADFNQIRRTVLGLASLELIEPRTARADWAGKLGLAAPNAKKEGQGTVIRLKDAKGEIMASLVVGNAVEGASTNSRQAIYVRKLTENQTYVARGSLETVSDPAAWLDRSFIDFPRDRIRTVSMKPPMGSSYTVTRATPETENFSVVERLPSGRTLRSEAEPNGIGNALIGMSFTDVVPQGQVDFSKAARASFQTFDGLALNVLIAQKDQDFWVAFDAVEIPAAEVAKPDKDSKLKPNIPREVEELNAMGKGLAYKIPRFKGTLLTTPLEALLNVPGGHRATGN
jgi:hypothetical protein